MRPQEVAASVEPAQWETILAAVREHNPALWRDLERAACQDQRIPPRLWQRYGPADRRAHVRRALAAPASGPLALDVLREYLLAEQRSLVIRFLDLAGVAHEEGVLVEGPVPEPEAATLDAAVETLLTEEPRAMALLYLRALSAQDNVEWPRLEARLTAEAQALPPPPPESPSRRAPAPAAPPARGDAARRTAPAPATEADAGPGHAAPPDVTGHAAIAPAPPGEPLGGAPNSRSPSPPASNSAARGQPGDGAARSSAQDARERAAASGTEGAAPTLEGPLVGRPRPLTSSAVRKGDRSPSSTAAAPAPREVKAARNGTGAAAPTPNDTPPPAPPAVRERRAAPRAPRPAPAARLALPPSDPPGLSALDRLLLRTRAASLIEAHGAPDAAEWQAILAEVVALSAERPRSAYHLGLLAAAGDAAAVPPAGSAAHAAWYHAGRLAGWAQRARWAEIARFYADAPGAAGTLFRHGEGLDAWAGAWLLAGLLAADVPALAADVLRHCPAVANLAARETLLDAADALLHGERPAEASVILDVLAALPPLAATPDTAAARPPLAAALDAGAAGAGGRDNAASPAAGAVAPTNATLDAAAYHARLRRAQAECLQTQGLFGAARTRLEAALAEAAGDERARLLGALGLVAGELAQLAELRLPEAELDPAPWRRRLEAGAPYFHEALAAASAPSPPSIGGAGGASSSTGEPSPSLPAPSPILQSDGATVAASLGLAALEWLSERPAAARPHFEAALAALQAPAAAHQRRGVLPQAQFYLGACLLLDLDTAAHGRALDLLRQATAAGFRTSPHTWQRLLDLVALDGSLADPLFGLFSQQAAAADAAAPFPPDLVQAFLVRCAARSDAARRRLAQECARAHVPADQRWEMLLRLLRAQREAGDPDGARATLDTLEGLALAPAEDSHARLQRWCDFLADPAHYEPEWSWDDVLWSRVRTLEMLGRDDDAFWLLDAPFSRLLAEATPEALAAADDLLAHARALAVSPEARTALPEMTARLRARQEAARQEGTLDEDSLAAQLRAGRVLRVLWVGGNETQARHERELRAALEQRDEASGGRVVLEFRTPGFNSNWDKTLEAVRGYRGRVDALVLMPFVRTQLGRALRRLASEFDIPWVPCTGKGYDSMERALRLAILLAASR